MPYLSHSHLVIYIYGESYTINYRKLFPRTTKRKYMLLNAGMELPICERNGHVFPWSRPSAVLKMLVQYGCPNTCAPKNDFFSIFIQHKLR